MEAKVTSWDTESARRLPITNPAQVVAAQLSRRRRVPRQNIPEELYHCTGKSPSPYLSPNLNQARDEPRSPEGAAGWE